MKKFNFILICALAAFSSAQAAPVKRVVTSTGAVFERVPYSGFKNQTSAWKDLQSGFYWSDTLSNRYLDTVDGLGLPMKLTNCGPASEAVNACKSVADSGHIAHLPTLEEYIDFNSRFEADPSASRELGVLRAYALSARGMEDLHKVTDIDGIRNRSGGWDYWTSTINPDNHKEAGRFDGETGAMSLNYFTDCDYTMQVHCIGN